VTDKELRSLSKPELLEMMYQQVLEIEKLSAEKDEALKKLDERRVSLEEAGSLAEASLMLSGVMKAAQDAADVYLENIRNIEADKAALAERLENEAKEKSVAIYVAAEQRRAEAENATKQIVVNTQRFLDWYSTQLDAMRNGFREMAISIGMWDMLNAERDTETEE